MSNVDEYPGIATTLCDKKRENMPRDKKRENMMLEDDDDD